MFEQHPLQKKQGCLLFKFPIDILHGNHLFSLFFIWYLIVRINEWLCYVYSLYKLSNLDEIEYTHFQIMTSVKHTHHPQVLIQPSLTPRLTQTPLLVYPYPVSLSKSSILSQYFYKPSSAVKLFLYVILLITVYLSSGCHIQINVLSIRLCKKIN